MGHTVNADEIGFAGALLAGLLANSQPASPQRARGDAGR